MTDESSAHEQIKRAQALIELGRQEQAIELLVTIPQTTPVLVAAVNCFLADAFARMGKKDEAYACARRALEAEPNNATALYWLATVEPDDAAALQHTSRLIELDPDWIPYQSLHAISLLRNGRMEEAEAVAREAARQAPEDIYVLSNLGDVLQERRSPEAEEVYARVLEIDPDDLHARKALAWIKQKDEADESARLYTDILATDPDQGDIALQLNWIVFGNMLSACVDVLTGYAVAWLLAGLVYAVGLRTVAVVIGLLASLIFGSGVARSFKVDTAKLGTALGMSPRAAFIRIYAKLPVSSIMATLATIMMILPPLIWAVLALVGRASSWWAAVGLPILIMACGLGLAYAALRVVRTYRR